jgi:hypothetical protein
MNPDSLRRLLAFDSLLWVAPLVLALMLAAAMSFSSAFNAHPDEIHHARAADYYRTNWLPPKFGDPAAVPSYSKYGVSYLHDREIVYLLAGKWSNVVAPLVGDINLAYRLFNLTLLAAIALAFALKPEARPLIVPLLLSAQIWYVFSYFNGDAFALAAALYTAYQISARGSLFNAAHEENGRRWLTGVLALGIGFALMLLAKRNYYLLIAFFIAYVALREIGMRAALAIACATLLGIGWYFSAPADTPVWLFACAALAAGAVLMLDLVPRLSDPSFRRRMGSFIAAGAFGLLLLLPRVAFDKLVVEDGANELSNPVATAERFASSQFKPSRITANTAFWGLRLRERGATYLALLFDAPHWLWLTFQSTVGVYGYMGIFAGAQFYVVIAMVYLAFFASLIHGTGPPGGAHARHARHALAIAGMYAALALLLSSLFSWVFDYQAQGRYLFPAFVMLGVALTEGRQRQQAASGAAAALAFLLAAYSFYDLGLALIRKA